MTCKSERIGHEATDFPLYRAGEWAMAAWLTPQAYYDYLTDCVKRWEMLGEYEQARYVKSIRSKFFAEHAVYIN